MNYFKTKKMEGLDVIKTQGAEIVFWDKIAPKYLEEGTNSGMSMIQKELNKGQKPEEKTEKNSDTSKPNRSNRFYP